MIYNLAFTQELQKSKVTIDEKLSNIDKSSITSGILYDRVMSGGGLTNYSQQNEPRTSNFNLFKQAWSDIERSSDNFRALPLKYLKIQLEEEISKNKVYIGMINTNIHTLNYDSKNPKSEKNGLRLVRDKFVPVRGKKLFIERQVLLIAPLKKSIKANNVDFNFSETYWFKGKGKKIKKLTIQFESQTFTVIENGRIANNSVNMVFKESGVKKLIFNAFYNDDSSQTTYGELYVKIPDLTKAIDYLMEDFSGTKGYNAPSTLAFQGYYPEDRNETTPISGHLDYRIFYHTNNGNTQKKLVKPLIIIDGFDPGDKRKIEDSDTSDDPVKHISMVDFLAYYIGEKRIPVLNEIRDLGYDVIFVNHPTYKRGTRTIDGGADYIERNALAHVGFYQYINGLVAQNGSSEKLVIIGPSMGGQISRYALAYMEDKGIPHNTRLWISVDSPHLGANIPLGAQALLHDAKSQDVDAAKDFVDKMLHSVAAKQQLIEQYSDIARTADPGLLNGRVVEQGYTFDQGSKYFKQYYKSLFNNGVEGSNGYPQIPKKIAIVNGSLSGSKEYFNPWTASIDNYGNDSQITLNIKGFQNLPVPFFNAKTHIASLETYNMPRYGARSKIARFKKTSHDDSMYATNNNSRGNMDIVPGGWFPSQNDIAEPLDGSKPANAQESFWHTWGDAWDNVKEWFSDWLGGSYFELRTLKHSSSFIPSFSALGHTSPDQSWAIPLSKNLVCSNETPFDSYFGQERNTQHTSFSKESFEWIKEELRGTETAPNFPVSTSALIGSSNICRGNTLTYTFAPCSTPTPVKKWTYSGYLTKVSHTSNSITLSAPSDSRIQGWVEAEFFNGVKMRKNIWIGKPSTPRSISGPTSVSEEGLVKYRGSYLSGATGYQWRLPYPSRSDKYALRWQITNGANTPYITALAGSNSGLVQFMGSNKCGSGGAATLSVTVGTGGGYAGDMKVNAPIQEGVASIYPNPVDKQLNINYNMEELSVNSIISLYDINGKVVYEKKGMVEHRTIDTSNFSEGLYFLVITNGVQQIRNKIIIQH